MPWCKPGTKPGSSLNDEEIQDHIFTMLVAGVDPTALALSWALYWIHEDPEVLARLRGEIDGLGPEAAPRADRRAALPGRGLPGDAPHVPGRDHSHRAEAARPGGDRTGGGIAPGVTLLPCTYLVHRRADLYPEPGRFRPERFLERQYASHEYFPFGGGARTCIGASWPRWR